MQFNFVLDLDGTFVPHDDPVMADSIEGAKSAAIELLKQIPGANGIAIYRDGVLVAEIDAQL